MGMLTVIATVSVSKVLKRQRLEVGANQIQGMIDKAYMLTGQHRTGVFLILTPTYSDGNRRLLLRADTNGDGQLSSSELAPFDASNSATGDPNNDLILTSDLVVTSCNWPVPAGGTAVQALLCDLSGRAMDASVSPPAQFTTGGLISLTHKDMMTTPPLLSPAIRYDIALGILWHAKLTKVRY
jgi:hypothetical protein